MFYLLYFSETELSENQECDQLGCGQLAHIHSRLAQVFKFGVKGETLAAVFLDPAGHETKTLSERDQAHGALNKVNK